MATGRRTVAPGQTIASDWGNTTWDQTVQTFASAADRDTQYPAPHAGAVAWLDDVKQLTYYTGTAWRMLAANKQTMWNVGRTGTSPGAASVFNLAAGFTIAGALPGFYRITCQFQHTRPAGWADAYTRVSVNGTNIGGDLIYSSYQYDLVGRTEVYLQNATADLTVQTYSQIVGQAYNLVAGCNIVVTREDA